MHRMALTLGVGAIHAIVILAAPALCPASWQVEDVVTGRLTSSPTLALDPTGRPAVAYGGTELTYAVREGSDWLLERVDVLGCPRGRRTGLAFDREGKPAIAYYRGEPEELRFARRVGSEWEIQTVDTLGEGNREVEFADASLAFDGAGNPTIAYYDVSVGLRFATWDGGAWLRETVDQSSGWGRHNSLAFDEDGDPAISYSDGSELRLARRKNQSWLVELVDEDGGACSLAFDASDNPAIAYVDQPASSLKYAHWENDHWVITEVDASFGGGCSLRFNEDTPMISYSWMGSSLWREIRLAVWNGATWDIERVAGTATDTSLGVDASGTPYVGYGAVRLASRPGADWESETVDETRWVGAGSLAFDPAGEPAIGYTRGSLEFLRREGGSWTSETVDAVGGNSFASLAFDGSGEPAISYMRFDHALNFAEHVGSVWSIQTVDSSGDTGWFSSLAYDAAGQPVIGYLDYDHAGVADLRIARWTGSWNLELVDQGVDFFSLALDADGLPAVSYGLGPELWFAHRDGVWTRERIDDGLAWDAVWSLAYDPAGNPAIAYCVDSELRLARGGAGWTIDVVASVESCQAVELAFGAVGQPAIAYRFQAGEEPVLGFAWSDGLVWNVETVATDANDPAKISMAFDNEGNASVLYSPSCDQHVHLATRFFSVTLHRGSVASLGAGWRAQALPLTSANDDETPPFPLPVMIPGTEQDPVAAGLPLTLYRLLAPGDAPAGNTLRVVKQPGAVELRY